MSFMNNKITLAVKPVDPDQAKGQALLSEFVQRRYIDPKKESQTFIDIRDDGVNGCENIIYIKKYFAARAFKVISDGKQIIICVIENPELDWFNYLPWERGVMIDQGSQRLQLQCAAMKMSDGSEADHFAVEIPIIPDLNSDAFTIHTGKLVRFIQKNDKKDITWASPIQLSITDIA